jgi:hypothetical protein
MAKQTLKTRKVTFMSRVTEMIGKISPVSDFLRKNSISWQLYSAMPSMDYSKTNYTLCRAIFYASICQDNLTSTNYGSEYILGASFGKPIVNSAAAFAFGLGIEVVEDDRKKKSVESTSKDKVETPDDVQYTIDYLNEWLEKYESEVFKWCRNGLRDGDQYILINGDESPTLFSPEQVDIIDNKLTGVVLGYDISTYVEEFDERGVGTRYKYVAQYRRAFPYYKLMKYGGKNYKDAEVVEQSAIPEDAVLDEKGNPAKLEDGTYAEPEKYLEKELPIAPFHNERDARERYGNSEYQNVFYLMANYHSVLEGAIKNCIYNSTALPVVKGIDDLQKWLEANGVKDTETGEYEVAWDKNKLLIGGKDFDVKIVGGVQNAEGSDKILNLLFWLICQGSETPEFVMGTAVASSNASVDSQMPIVLRKAERKRKESKQYYNQLIKVLLATSTDTQVVRDLVFKVKFPDIVNDDMKINVEIVKLLSDEGCITDKTKMVMLNMGKRVADIDQEIEDAKGENEVKAKLVADQFAENGAYSKIDQGKEKTGKTTNSTE